MSDWKCYQLKNLGIIKTGKAPPSSCKDAFSNTGVPFVTPKDMNGVKTIFKTERYLSKIGLDSVKNYLVPKNSIAVSCIGSDMGKAYLLSEDSVTNQQINTLIVNNNHNFEFIYYMWGSDNICIRKKKKFGGKKLAGAPVYGALAFLGGKFMQKWKMVGIGGKWSKIRFYFA
ncbi:TPA: restriction endonuclease subunit S [Haemophilus influenzae]